MSKEIRIVEVDIDQMERDQVTAHSGEDFWDIKDVQDTFHTHDIWTIDEYMEKLNDEAYPTDKWVVQINLCEL